MVCRMPLPKYLNLNHNSLRFESARNDPHAGVRKLRANREVLKRSLRRRFQPDGGTMNSGEDQVTSNFNL